MDTEQSIKKIIEKVGLSREEIKKRIDKTVESLSGLIDEEGALTIVAKELGINIKENQDAANIIPDLLISQIQPNSYVSITGRIEEIEERRNYNKKDGTQGMYFIFALRDKSGLIRCIVWDQNVQVLTEPGFTKNEIIRIVNGLIKASKNGGNEIHIGNKSKIQLNPDNVDYNNIPSVQERQLIFTKIADLTLNAQYVNIQGEVVTIFPPKDYTKKDNSTGKRASMVIKEGDSQTYITFWDDSIAKITNVNVNDIVQITKLRPKKNFRNETKIDLTVSSNSEMIIVQKTAIAGKNIQVSQLISIQEIVDKKSIGIIEGIIQDIENPRTVKMKDGTTKNVQALIIADETAALKVNLWGDQIIPNLKVNDVIRITNIYIKLNNYSQQNEGNLSAKGSIEKIEKQIQTTHTLSLKTEKGEKNLATNIQTQNISIDQINTESYYEFKAVIGRDFRQINFFKSCTQCKKKPENCTCVPPKIYKDRMIVNLSVEDETKIIRIAFFSDQAEKLLGETSEKVKEIYESEGKTEFLRSKNAELMGKTILIKGKAKFSQTNNTYDLNVNNFEFVNIEAESQQLIKLLNSDPQ